MDLASIGNSQEKDRGLELANRISRHAKYYEHIIEYAMEKRIKQGFKTLKRISQIFYRKNGMDVRPYTSPNLLKRSIYYRRLLNLLKIFPYDLDEDAAIVDFGAGQCLFSILLLSLGYKRVLSVDLIARILQKEISLLDFYNQALGADLALDVSREMPDVDIELICAIDVFEHFTREEAREIIQSNNASRYLLNLPSENLLYNLGTGFHREPTHKMRYFEVIAVFEDCGFDIRKKKGFLGLFKGYLLERAG